MTVSANFVDAGHFSLIEMIKVITHISGPGNAKGTLIRTGLALAAEGDTVEFPTMEEFLASVPEAGNPIARFEGSATYHGDGVFGLGTCPFAASIRSFLSVAGKMPAEFAEVTDKLNEPSPMTGKLRVGQGAAVSPFCGFHQTVRSELGAKKVRIGGKRLKVTQLGCKSGAGKKGVSESLCAEVGVDTALVTKVLDGAMCCYHVDLVVDDPNNASA